MGLFNKKHSVGKSIATLRKEKGWTQVELAEKLQVKGNSIYGTLGLRSGAYTVTYNAENDTFTFNVKGHGHGVGMSQVGAKGYANQGWDYKKILQHYYKGVVIK